MSRLNDEMKESSDVLDNKGEISDFHCVNNLFGIFVLFLPGDDTFTDVVRDFSNIASLNPERLLRKYDPDRHTNV